MGFQEMFFHEKLRMILLDPNTHKYQSTSNLQHCISKERKKCFGKGVGVNGLHWRFFDNGLRVLGFESGTLVGFILVA